MRDIFGIGRWLTWLRSLDAPYLFFLFLSLAVVALVLWSNVLGSKRSGARADRQIAEKRSPT